MAETVRTDAAPKRRRRTTTIQVTVIFAVILALLLGLLIAALVQSRSRQSALNQLDQQLLPASADVYALSTDYVDEETAERGYIIAGEITFLEPYFSAQADAPKRVAALHTDLRGDSAASRDLTRTVTAETHWTELAKPEIQLRTRGPETPAVATAAAEVGKTLFDNVRTALTVLEARVLDDVRLQSDVVSNDDSALNRLIVGSMLAAFVLVIGALLLVRRRVTKPIEGLMHNVEHYDETASSEPVPIAGTGDLRQLGQAIEEMRGRLKTEAEANLQRELIASAEDMRASIAADIHDDSAQAMTVVSLRLQQLSQRVDDPEMREMLAEVQSSVVEAMHRLRRLIFELQPPDLEGDEGAGLPVALEDYLDESMASTVDHTVRVEGDLTRMDVMCLTLAYRVAKEAILNAAKHSDGSTITVTLHERDDGLQVTVSDNGIGFDAAHPPPSTPGHLGLSSMRLLVTAASGWWRADSRPGAGCTVEFWLPARLGADATGAQKPDATSRRVSSTSD